MGGANQAGYTVTALTNGTAYTFELRAVSAGGNGAAAEAGPVTPNATCTDNDIDLVRGNDNSEGSVQICHNAQWRSVCDDGFDDTSDSLKVDNGTAFAGVVCRQAGYATGKATIRSNFGSFSPVSFWLDEVLCTGTEAHLGLCAHNDWGVSDCTFSERAGVQCTVAVTGLTAVGGNGELSLSWHAPGNDAGITRHEVRYQTDGGWAAIPDSAANETNEASYTVTGLNSGTDYTFQVRIVGGGNASEPATATARTTVALSTDATLSGLVVNDGSTDLTLIPGFAPDEYSYAVTVANSVSLVTVTTTTTDTTATIDYLNASDVTLDDAGTAAGQQVALAAGANVINVKVTAGDGATTLTYTVTVTQAASGAPTIAGVAVTSTPILEPDTYGEDETIEISVTFNEAVTATDVTDFVLSVSGRRRAPLSSGSGTETLVFRYIVVAGDNDTNGIWTGNQDRTLVGNRNGEPQTGTITSVATGVAADLTHGELGTQPGHKVDGSRSATLTNAMLNALVCQGRQHAPAADPVLRAAPLHLHDVGGEQRVVGDGDADEERRERDDRLAGRERHDARRRGHGGRPAGDAGGGRQRHQGEGDGRHGDGDLHGDGVARGHGPRGAVPPGARDRGGLRGLGRRSTSRGRESEARRDIPCRTLGHGVQRRYLDFIFQHPELRHER